MIGLRVFTPLLAVWGAMSGCSQPARESTLAAPVARAVVRVYGTEFVRPEDGAAIVLIAAQPWTPGGSIAVATGDDELMAPVHHLRIAPRTAPSWTGAPVEWSIGESIEAELAPGASAVALLPPLPAGVTSVTIDGSEVRIEPPTDAWPASLSSAEPAPPSSALVGAELGDPTRAWRIDLSAALAGEKSGAKGGDGMTQLRRQHAARWRAALSRLTAVDSALGSRVAASLGRVIRMDGHAVPAWSADLRRLDALLESLLRPESDAAGLKLAAEAWLADEPGAVAWVIDDGGKDRPVLIGVANLSDARAPASISASGAVELAALEPRTGLQLAIAQPSGAATVRAETRVGDAIFQLELVTQPIPCTPPGVRMGPLMPEWTMPEWLGERAGSIDVGWATAALLQPKSGGEGAWEVFLDCRAERSGHDTVRLALGPPAKPDGEIRVSRSGAIEGSGGLVGVKGVVREEEEGWTATLELPSAAMGQAVVTIGLERVDARGFRSTWPRRVTPWQRQLPGGEIDLSAWGGLGGREPGSR